MPTSGERAGVDSAGQTARKKQLWIVAPEARKESSEQAQLRLLALRSGEAMDLSVVTRRTRQCVIQGGPDAHKRFELMEPRDARDLYAAMHRSKVLVLALTAGYIRCDPSEVPTRKRHARRLEDYVRYKASYGLARGPRDVSTILDTFERWPRTQMGRGIGVGDPRILPLHVFDNSSVWTDLDGDDGLSRFVAQHGSDSRRSDGNGRRWVAAPVGHGRDTLEVSGFVLPTGFHWDVQMGKNSERLTTCHEVWKLNPRGYANVYPDAFVRVTDRRGRRVWSAV
jgi:hypothetical protein